MRNNNNKNEWEEIRRKKENNFPFEEIYFYLSFCFSRFKRNLKNIKYQES